MEVIMRKLLKKYLPISMASLVLLNFTMPVFAQVEEEQIINKTQNSQTEVFYNQASSFEVIVPKLVDLGSDKFTNYEVTVSGDISSDEMIAVVPEESFLMEDISGLNNKKDDIVATVIQDKTEWIFNEFETKANGNISAPDLTAGKWQGSFFFNIELQDILKPGLYDENGNILYSWDELVNEYNLDIERDYANEELQLFASNYWDLPGIRLSYTEDMSALNDDLSKCTKLVIGDNVTKIGSGAFYGNVTIKEIVIPDSVKSINLAAFLNCTSLEKIQIPNSVEYIGNFAFAECMYLKEINIPKDITKIEDYAFYDCMSLTNIVIPNNVESIGHSAFENCVSATNIQIGNSVKEINEYAFCGCTSLTNIKLSESVETLGEGAFWCCYNLKEIELSENINTIGNSAFRGCLRLESIIIPNNVTKIGAYMFKDCVSLKEIKLSDNLIEIGLYAFYDCDSLKTITIPNSVEKIDTNAFNDCDYLTEILYNGNDINSPWGATNAIIKK
jgi:hypothetical protein